MTPIATRFFIRIMLGVATLALSACETPEEHIARVSQHNGKTVAHVSALFGAPVKRTRTEAVWAMRNSFVVRHPVEEFYNNRWVIVGWDYQTVNQYCELTTQLKRNVIISSSVNGTGCLKMVPRLN